MLNHKWLYACCLIVGCSGAAQQGPAPSTSAAAAAATPGADPIAAAAASDLRSAENKQRDSYRHPVETLRFFGVEPTQTVVELWPGRGWYTEILAPMLREQGKLRAAVPTGNYLAPYKEFLAARPAQLDRVELVELTPPDKLALAPDGSADTVLTFRNIHGWVTNGYAKQIHEAVFRALKPGGVYGVVEHRANPGATPEESAKSGYVSEEAVIAMATAAGFVLEERSEINANPKDTKDHVNGVWSLPPTLKGGDAEREKFVAIGESDRMTLRFRKPVR